MTLIVYFLCARDLFLLDMLLIKKQIRTKKEALNYENFVSKLRLSERMVIIETFCPNYV